MMGGVSSHVLTLSHHHMHCARKPNVLLSIACSATIFCFLAGGCGTVDHASLAGHYVPCRQNDAQVVADFSITPPKGLSTTTAQWYFKEEDNPLVKSILLGPSKSSDGIDAKGRPISDGVFLAPDFTDGVLSIKASWYWMRAGDAGEGSALIRCPFMADRKGELNGARYSVTWKRVDIPPR